MLSLYSYATLVSASNEHVLKSMAYRSSAQGAMGFFRGVGPNALKTAPSAAITFVVYEETIKRFRLAK